MTCKGVLAERWTAFHPLGPWTRWGCCQVPHPSAAAAQNTQSDTPSHAKLLKSVASDSTSFATAANRRHCQA
eukprot:366316-Chlamydomonas_euryale.AAC.7